MGGWREGRFAAHGVVVVGGGPTGLMLAAELALAKVDVVVVERRAGQDLSGPRARGLHARTIEVLDQRGIADRFLSEGQAVQVQSFAGTRLDISDFPTRHNYGLALPQKHFERILAAWVDGLGVPIQREREVAGLTQDDTGVDVQLSDGRALRAAFLVGCDGGRSLIRKAAGIEFPGWDPSVSSLIAEAEWTEEPEWGIRHDVNGTQAVGRLEDGNGLGVVVSEPYAGQTGATLPDLRRALVAVWGTDFGVHSPTWISRFTDLTRQAASYRAGRVLLAGDAAHVHYPVGGQGLNLGVQDAVNLGWKLAQVVKGTAPESLLDTYHAERHPVAAGVLQKTMAQTALTRSEPRIDAVRDTLAELLSLEEPRKRLAGMVSGLDIRYDLGEGHPLLGRRIPDLDLVTAGGPTRIFTLLHDARPLLLRFGDHPHSPAVTPWAGRVRVIEAEPVVTWELPVAGSVTAPTTVLVRPDGHVAWTGEGTDAGLVEALETWFGPASQSAS
jgi:2-polyprenyl-6-methoxyphenol hydroxylase-like FAD-dependent oxidoreductase